MSLAQRVLARKLAAVAGAVLTPAPPPSAVQPVAAPAAAPAENADRPPRPRYGSLASRKAARHLAGQLTPANDNQVAAPDAGPRAAGYQEVILQLDADKRRLKEIQSVTAKIDAKRGMLPTYDAWIQGVLEAGIAVQDEVVLTAMVWRIDIGDYAGALDIAAWVIAKGVPMPERFKRGAAVLVAEEIANAALAAFKLDQDFAGDIIGRSIALTEKSDMPDEVRAKQFKAFGLMLERAANNPTEEQLQAAFFVQSARTAALEHLRNAMRLNAKAGVVKDIERLERALAKPDTA